MKGSLMKPFFLLSLLAALSTAGELSLCGVLTTGGHSDLTFLIPSDAGAYPVKRYEVIRSSESVPPLASVANWWICITDGVVHAEPTDESYGKIEIHRYQTDQTNGERGME